jgi:sulfide:quinone oxidoreductase
VCTPWLRPLTASNVWCMVELEHVAQRRRQSRPRVVIAGAGVAGLEVLLALRALAGDRVDITLIAPERRFIDPSTAVMEPFNSRGARGLRIEDVADEFDARWCRRVLDRVEHRHQLAITRDGVELPYDMLVLALGTRPEREWTSDGWLTPSGWLTFHDARDEAAYRLLLHQLREGRFRRLAFVKPGGASWPLPLYDLAFLTAADCATHQLSDVALSLITPEDEPLGIFGAPVSDAVRRMLEAAGVVLYTSSFSTRLRSGRLAICPGERQLPVDRVVSMPRLVGPRLRGIPCGSDGFIHTDLHGRVHGRDRVFAAGDATAFPIKHGGLAAQQADAVAQAIAASIGIDIDPQPFQPVLHGVLLTGTTPRYLRADIRGSAGDASTISTDPMWWPPEKLSARHLAPYLRKQSGDGADVMSREFANARPVAAHTSGTGAR